MSSRTTARHRKATRALTPLDDFAPTTHRGLAVAASSNLALAMMASGASAAGHIEVTPSGTIKTPGIAPGVGIFAANAREVLAARRQATMSQVSWVIEATPEVEAVVLASVAPQAPVVPEAPVTQTEQTSSETVAPAIADRGTGSAAADMQAAQVIPAVTSASTSNSSVVAIVMQYIGTPYVWSVSSPSVFDYSGFTQHVYAQVGINLPHTFSEQAASDTPVSAAKAQPGDLTTWPGHVGICAGDSRVIDADSENIGVVCCDLWDSLNFIRVG